MLTTEVSKLPIHSIPRRSAPPATGASWHSPFWSTIPALSVARFHPHSTRHHPRVQAKLAHTSNALHIMFRVEDRFLVCEKTELHQQVCQDSCVEAFLQPRPDKGYFNFEINCGGTLLLFYVTNNRAIGPTGDGYAKIDPADAARVIITPSIREKKPFHLTGPLTWTLQYSFPIAILEKHVGPLGPLEGQQWRGNFYKCADHSKYPHWASWSPIGAPLRFHQPDRYGTLHFRAT